MSSVEPERLLGGLMIAFSQLNFLHSLLLNCVRNFLLTQQTERACVHTSYKAEFADIEFRRQFEISAERLSENAKSIKITLFAELFDSHFPYLCSVIAINVQ